MLNVDRYFRINSYALVGTAFASLALTGELEILSIALYLAAFGVSYYVDEKNLATYRLSEKAWRWLGLAYVPFLYLDSEFLSHSRILALVHMTLFVSAAKLFQEKRDRDWVILYVVGFFQLLLAAGLTFSASFLVSLAVFLFFFVSSLTAFEIRRALRETECGVAEIIPQQGVRGQEEAGNAKPKLARSRYLVGASAAQIVIVVAITVPLFFLIPRFGGGAIRGFGSDVALSGFSDQVKLGEIASIKQSSRIVMRVRLNRDPGRTVRWRGIALESYDGRMWSMAPVQKRFECSRQGLVARGAEGPGERGGFNRSYALGTQPTDQRAVLEQRFILETLNTPTLFAARRPFFLSGPISDTCLDLVTGAISGVGVRGRTAYVVRSDLSTPSEQKLKSQDGAETPPQIRETYLQLPARLDPRIAGLAAEVTRTARTPYEKSRALENYLKTAFSYSLTLRPTTGDPLAEFLFETREGHCEYFATALAVMLRTLGIPARIVNGFQMGEYNDVSGLYTVRESDAHSWVEAYYAGAADWVEFDPTPASGINEYPGGGLFAGMRKYLEAAEIFWLDYVVTLEGEEQASMMVEIQQQMLTVKDTIGAYFASAKRWVKAAITDSLVDRQWRLLDVVKVLALTLLLLASGFAIYGGISYRRHRDLEPTGYSPWWRRWFVVSRWRKRAGTRGDPRRSAVLFYEQMLAIAARAGALKRPDQTPLEFAAACGLVQIYEITRVYNRIRFGGERFSEADARRVADLLTELKQSVRSGKRPSLGKPVEGSSRLSA